MKEVQDQNFFSHQDAHSTCEMYVKDLLDFYQRESSQDRFQ